MNTTYLDTLAQLTVPTESTSYEEKKNTLLKRARAKFITNKLIINLVEVENTKLKKSYWNTYHCAALLEQSGNEITSKYCGNRWCLVCNRIRTAKLIKSYHLPISEIKDKQFVTLTIPNVCESKLKKTIDEMYKAFRTIQKRLNYHKIKIIGIRKFECTYNPERQDFHPHYHFILEGKENAKILIDKWLEYFPNADRQAQDMREGNEKSMIELFKYFTKLMPSKKSKRKVLKMSALNSMFEAMQGKRIFQSFGIRASKEVENEEITNLESQIYSDLENYFCSWIWKGSDWINMQEMYDTGEIIALTNYVPSDSLKKMLENIER